MNQESLVKKATASAPVGDDPLVYVMSDESEDRMGDVIEAKGWQLGNFLKNPVALFGHDHKFIIGHWTDVKVQGQRLIGRLNLLPKGISERLDEVRAAVEAGILRAVSVGFAPDPEEMEQRKSGGLLFRAAELLECSLVAVPANPNALQIAKSLDLSEDVRSLIFREPATLVGEKGAELIEIPADDKPAHQSKGRVVKLDAAVPTGAQPFVIRKIKRTA